MGRFKVDECKANLTNIIDTRGTSSYLMSRVDCGEQQEDQNLDDDQ